MSQPDQDLERLKDVVSALPRDSFPKTLSALDGYVTGILCCPDVVPPSEWLCQVWSETGAAVFPDMPTAEAAISAVVAHYNAVALEITNTLRIRPIYEVDPDSGERRWEEWIDGFTRAIRLRPEVWKAVLETGNGEIRSAWAFLMALKNLDERAGTFTKEEMDKIDIRAPDLTPDCIAAILLGSRACHDY